MKGITLKNLTEIRIDAPVKKIGNEIIQFNKEFSLIIYIRKLYISMIDIILSDTRVQNLFNCCYR